MPVALFLVAVLVVAGAAVVGTAAYFELAGHPVPPGGPTTVSVVDDRGRVVAVPTDPARVVVLGPNIVDTMVRLGLRSSIVGVDCSPSSYGGLGGDYTPNQTADWQLTAAMCVQSLPSVDTEELLNLSPTLVLATSIVAEAPVDEFGATYGVPVVWLVPGSLGGIVGDVGILGTIFPEATGASALEATLQEQIANATERVANLTAAPNATLPRVLLTYYVDPTAGYYTYGPGTFGDSLLVLAGAVNLAANASVPYPVLAGSQVLAAQPSVVVYGTGTLGESLPAYAQAPDWGSLTARKVPLDVTEFTEADPTMILEGLPALIAAIGPAT